ncbi:MAG: hypothetical protein H0X26_01115 [Alphaproteobacteria bacterium]|nr:hypothetical protein [Alphaproteobacteria bacterium]
MNKLMISAIALGAILTLNMNQPVAARGGGGHHGGGGHYAGGHHDGGHHGYDRRGYGYGYGYGYGVGALGVGIGLGAIGATVYDNSYYGGYYNQGCTYDSYGNKYCYNNY